MIKKIFITIGILLFNCHYLYATESMSKITTSKVVGNIYMIEGSEDHKILVSGDWDNFTGGNIGLSIGKDGVLIVDAKYIKYSDQVKEVIKSVGGGAPKYILDTHFHDDHINANSVFNKQGTVIAHSKARTRIIAEQPEEAWPVITFDDKISIHFNGEEIKIIHFSSGHTDGDAIIYFTNSNVVHMGDLYFNGYLPFIDLDSGGDAEGYMNNIERIVEHLPDDIRIIPGHGPVASKEDLRNYSRMLQETMALVTGQMKAGKTLADIQNKGLQEEWAKLTWSLISMDKYIETIYKSFAK
jgi:cyclase